MTNYKGKTITFALKTTTKIKHMGINLWNTQELNEENFETPLNNTKDLVGLVERCTFFLNRKSQLL